MSHSATETTRKEHPLGEREKLQMLLTLLTSNALSINVNREGLQEAFKYVLDKVTGGKTDPRNGEYWDTLYGEFRVYWATRGAGGEVSELSGDEIGTLSNFIEFAKRRENPPLAENSP